MDVFHNLIQWWAHIMKQVQTNIQVYLDAQELNQQTTKYIRMSMNWLIQYPNKFGYQRIDWKNIFGGSRNDRMNIQTYLSPGKATHMNTNSTSRPFLYLNTQIYVSSLKQVKTDQYLSKIVQIGQESILWCTRIFQTNIQTYL